VVECFVQAERRRAFQRAFKVSVGLDLAEVRDHITMTQPTD